MISDQYAAGFFDGEGTVYAAVRNREHGGNPTVVVCIGNTHRGVLDQHCDRWGGSIAERGGRHAARVATGRWQRQFQWVIAARKAKPFLLAIAPYVVIKANVVRAGLEYIALMETPRAERVDYSGTVYHSGRLWVSPKTRPEFRARVDAIHGEIRRLNQLAAPGNVNRVPVMTGGQ